MPALRPVVLLLLGALLGAGCGNNFGAFSGGKVSTSAGKSGDTGSNAQGKTTESGSTTTGGTDGADGSGGTADATGDGTDSGLVTDVGTLDPCKEGLIDFENVPGVAAMTEGLDISTQYKAKYGVSFHSSDGSLPRLAKFDNGQPNTGENYAYWCGGTGSGTATLGACSSPANGLRPDPKGQGWG